MLLSRKWLDEFVHVDANDKDFAEAMTLSGSKVETTEDRGAEISNVVVGTHPLHGAPPGFRPHVDLPAGCGPERAHPDRHRRLEHPRGRSGPRGPGPAPPSPAARRSRRASCGAWSPTA